MIIAFFRAGFLMFELSLKRADVRKQVDQVLRTDADLEAFCLDYFPCAFQRFGQGMERTEKVNLLFALVDLADIVAKLRERDSSCSSGRLRMSWGVAGVVLLGMALAMEGVYWVVFREEPVLQPPALTADTPTTMPQADLKATSPSGINSGNAILDSSGAQMNNRAPGVTDGVHGETINSGNRITGSAGAVMSNEVH